MFTEIDRGLRLWHVLAAFAVAASLGAFLGFVAQPRLQDYSGGLDIFDMRMAGYGHDDAVAMLSALGSEGRAYYRSVQFADIAFPPAWFFATALGFLYMTRPGARFAAPLAESARFAVVAIAGMALVLDWSENVVVFMMLMGDGTPSASLVGLGSLLTVVKGLAYLAVVAALVVAGALALPRGLTQRRLAPGP